MRVVLLAIAIVGILEFTAWSIGPSAGNPRRTLSIDPFSMMTTPADLFPEQYDAF